MSSLFFTALMGLGFLVLVPSSLLLAEVLAACLPRPAGTTPKQNDRRERIAVLVPAHDEAAGIKATIEDIKTQLLPTDRIVVVADNCTDETASVAAALGAEVSVRNDPERIGKGYALDWGIRYLAAAPPDIVITVDADCRVAEAAIPNLSQICFQTGHPVQALYLMTAASGSINQQIARFAWLVKNFVRPLGLSNLKLPCQLMGTGMAFPWKLIQSADLATDSIVEDMKLGLEFAAQGRAPLFYPSAVVTSTFPSSEAGSSTQRKRWEQGHLSLIVSAAPKLAFSALKRRDFKLLTMALDLIVPPLSLLFFLNGVATAVTGGAALLGATSKPFCLSVTAFAFLALAVLLAWAKYARSLIPASDLILILPYLLKKIRLYTALIKGAKVSHWTRTDRG